MFKNLLEEFEQSIMELDDKSNPVTKEQLDMLERYLDSLYAKNNMDFEFTRHFIDRVNDPRNGQPITFDELKKMFIDAQKRYGASFAKKHKGFQAAIRAVGSKLNAPFIIDIHPRTGHLDLVTKTIMRKDHFHTPDPIYNVESIENGVDLIQEDFDDSVVDHSDAANGKWPIDIGDSVMVDNYEIFGKGRIEKVSNSGFVSVHFKNGENRLVPVYLCRKDINEVSAPGQEDWIKKNKKTFHTEYGRNKGDEVLYATAWKRSKNKSITEADESEEIPQTNEKAAYGIYDIPFSRWNEFQIALDKVNKKAIKYGIKPLTISSKEKIDITHKNPNALFPIYAWHITLEGEPIKIKGWEFLASLEHSSTNGNVIRFVPGKEEPRVKQYVKASHRNCDFCHSQRDRLNTYIVRNTETSDLKQVGGQCLQKYIGDTARKLARFSFSMANIIDELMDDERGFSGGGTPTFDARTALAASILTIKAHGYTSNAVAQDRGIPATSTYLKCGLFGWCPSREFEKDFRELLDVMQKPSAEYFKQADDMIKWFNDLPEEQKSSSYMISIGSIIDADMVTGKSIGLIASLPASYHRYMNGVKQRAEEKPSSHVGSIGIKIPSTKVKCVYAQNHDGMYGSYQLVKFVDDIGNVYTWFNTGRNDMETGSFYEIIGTVKKHDDYQGKKQTILTRVKAKQIENSTDQTNIKNESKITEVEQLEYDPNEEYPVQAPLLLGDHVRVYNPEDLNYHELTGIVTYIGYEDNDVNYPYAKIKVDEPEKFRGHKEIEAAFNELERIDPEITESEDTIPNYSYNKILKFSVTKVFDLLKKKAKSENKSLVDVIQGGLNTFLFPIIKLVSEKLRNAQWFDEVSFAQDLKDTVQHIIQDKPDELNEQILNEIIKKVSGKWALCSKSTGKPLRYYKHSGYPSKDWISKQEQQIHSFKAK